MPTKFSRNSSLTNGKLSRQGSRDPGPNEVRAIKFDLPEPPADDIFTMKFEIFGKVYRVRFREAARKKANELDLKGYIRYSDNDTVTGVIEGPEDEVRQMKIWLQTKGSRKSRIDGAVFSLTQETNVPRYQEFTIRPRCIHKLNFGGEVQ